MKCPQCKVDLKTIDFRGIKIEECPKCVGRWFDRQELQKLIEKTDEDLSWIDFDAFQEEDKFRVKSEGKTCPKCGKKMNSMTYRNSGVVIDLCRECGGVWLDKNEFAKIVENLRNLMWDKPSSEYSAELGKQFIDIVSHPTHALSEIKDFFVVLKLLELRMMSEHPDLARAVEAINSNSPFK